MNKIKSSVNVPVVIASTALASILLAASFLSFVVSNEWPDLLSLGLSEDDTVTISSLLQVHRVDIALRLLVSCLTNFFLAILILRFQLVSVKVMIFALSIGATLATVFMWGFKNEFMFSSIYRSPPGNLGYFHPPAVYSSAIAVASVCFGFAVIVLTVLRKFMKGIV